MQAMKEFFHFVLVLLFKSEIMNEQQIRTDVSVTTYIQKI